MPLKPGKKNIGANIKELENAPTKRPHAQIIAIALHTAKVPQKKKLGDAAKQIYNK
jgi:hypothetical protein